RVRRARARPDLFVVVSDAFLTETAELADVVLPAAIWGEKTGCFTNVDRTVHISHQAIDPPGEAKSDLDIFLDYARRMDFRDKDGAPLIKWSDPEGAFEAWKRCSRGRACDYTGMSYAKLTGGSGVRWPCNEAFPDGAERRPPARRGWVPGGPPVHPLPFRLLRRAGPPPRGNRLAEVGGGPADKEPVLQVGGGRGGAGPGLAARGRGAGAVGSAVGSAV